MKRFFALVLVLVLCLALGSGALAAGGESPSGREDIKIAMFGDSVLAGQLGGKPPYTLTQHLISDTVAQELGVKVRNFGVGSMGWISKQYLNRTAEGYVPRCDLTGYDMAVFMYGLNDGDKELGHYTDTQEQTIMGAVYRVCEYLHETYPGLQVVLCTPTPSLGDGQFPGWGFTTPHDAPDGWTFEMMRDEYRLFCDRYHLHLIEGDRCFSSWNMETYMGDHVHPNEEGYIVAGRYIAGQLGALL